MLDLLWVLAGAFLLMWVIGLSVSVNVGAFIQLRRVGVEPLERPGPACWAGGSSGRCHPPPWPHQAPQRLAHRGEARGRGHEVGGAPEPPTHLHRPSPHERVEEPEPPASGRHPD